ncbi:outer membrane protein [Desulfatibacillum alkenivorans DSM 16219]|uniref:Outer membrane protein n=1 Tax=Desulfatibacillum alkenivorans DSM 16219 TaxID=1121393 RepID=A0A1M6P0X6_9BACT|nr:TolC family protein [Desulfatibacillum alkenivorans]SHK01591.1 outer membrane protein [Desulfatibacillum alkenivorans DSM 16219]
MTHIKRKTQRIWAMTAALILCLAPAFAQNAEPLTLEKAVALALEHNQDLRMAQNSVKSAEITVKQDKDDFLPSLSASTSWSASADRADSTEDSTFQSLNAALSSSLNLFNGYGDQAALEKSRYSLSAEENTRNRTMQSVIYSTMAAFFQAYTAREKIKVAANNLEDNARQLDEIQAFYDAGSKPVTDLYQQKAQTSSAQLDLLTAQRDYSVNKIQLMEAIGMPASASFEIAAPALRQDLLPAGVTTEGALNQALAQRPDIQSQNETISAAQASIKENKAGFLPSLDLTGEVGTNYSSGGDLGFEDQFWDQSMDARVGLSLSIPIFDRNITRNNVAKARISLNNAELELEKIKRQVEVEIGQAVADYQTAEKKVQVTRDQLEYATQALDSSSQRYTVGASTLTELTQARTTFVEAQYDQIEAEVNLRIQAMALAFYSGTLDAKDISAED